MDSGRALEEHMLTKSPPPDFTEAVALSAMLSVRSMNCPFAFPFLGSSCQLVTACTFRCERPTLFWATCLGWMLTAGLKVTDLRRVAGDMIARRNAETADH